MTVEFFNILTFLWLMVWAIHAAMRLARGDRSAIYFVMLVYFVYTGVPLLADVLLGQPHYPLYPGIEYAVNDEVTSLIYCGFVALVPVVWGWLGKSIKSQRASQDSVLSDSGTDRLIALLARFRFLLHIMLWTSIVAILLAPAPQLYLTYSAAALRVLEFEGGIAALEYHNFVLLRIFKLSLFAAAGLLLSYQRLNLLTWIYVALPVGVIVWVDGKRSVVAIVLVLLGFVLWQRGTLRGRRLLLMGVAAIVLMGSFSTFQKSVVRDKYSEESTFEDVYQDVRIDFGRDDRIKFAIFAELNPDVVQILNFRGESLQYYALLWVPREIWPEKPIPYAYMFTNAAKLRPPDMLRGGLTTSLLDEMIANLSWAGMIVGPLAIALICRIGDSMRDGLVQLLTIILGIMLLSVHFVSVLPIAVLWAASIVMASGKSKPVADTDRFGMAPHQHWGIQ